MFLYLVSEQAGTGSWEAVKEPGADKIDRCRGVDRDPSLCLPRWTGDRVSGLQLALINRTLNRILKRF